MPSRSKTEIPWAWGHAWVVTGLAAEARLSQIAWGLFLTAGVQRPPPPPCRKCAHSQSTALSQACLTGVGERRSSAGVTRDAPAWAGDEGGAPRGASRAAEPHTLGGAPCFPLFPGPYPHGPLHVGIGLCPRGPDGDMAGSHLVFSQDPQTPPLVPCLPHPNHPLLLCPLGLYPCLLSVN